MIKRVLLIFIFFMFVNLSANDTKLALELARSKNLDVVINRVNTIYEYINLFILETGSVPANIAAITNRYPNIVTTGFNQGLNITFTIANNIITFANIVPNNLSAISRQLYRNNPNLHPQGTVNINDTITIRLNPKAMQVLTRVAIITANNATPIAPTDPVVFDIDTTPSSCQAANSGRLWYRPDATGGFIVSVCAAGTYTRLANDLNIYIYRPTEALLQQVRAPIGTKGYAVELATGTLREYICTTIGANPWVRVN